MPSDLALEAPAASPRLRQAAIPALFLLLGVIYASWAARLPTVRDALALDPATLGTVLLGGGIGGICSFPVSSWLVGHYGARRGALYAGIALLIVLPTLAVLPNWWLLMAGMVALGLTIGAFDVAINALGAEAEQAAGRSIMSMLHAWFCVGTFLGALAGSGAAAISLTPLLHFTLVGCVLAVVLGMAYRVLPCDAPDPELGRQHFALPHGAVIWLGMIALLGAISEGSLTSWIAIFLRDHLHASEAVAPLGYAAFAGAMLVSRLVGDAMKEKVGAQRLVSLTSLVAAVGIAISTFAPTIPLATVGFFLAGVGVAAVFPCIFSAAGREGASTLAAVATLGYSGGLLGPPAMGFMVHGFGLQAGLGFLAVISVAVCVAATSSRLLR